MTNCSDNLTLTFNLALTEMKFYDIEIAPEIDG